jgi:hypothetical protein
MRKVLRAFDPTSPRDPITALKWNLKKDSQHPLNLKSEESFFDKLQGVIKLAVKTVEQQ